MKQPSSLYISDPPSVIKRKEAPRIDSPSFADPKTLEFFKLNTIFGRDGMSRKSKSGKSSYEVGSVGYLLVSRDAPPPRE